MTPPNNLHIHQSPSLEKSFCNGARRDNPSHEMFSSIPRSQGSTDQFSASCSDNNPSAFPNSNQRRRRIYPATSLSSKRYPRGSDSELDMDLDVGLDGDTLTPLTIGSPASHSKRVAPRTEKRQEVENAKALHRKNRGGSSKNIIVEFDHHPRDRSSQVNSDASDDDMQEEVVSASENDASARASPASIASFPNLRPKPQKKKAVFGAYRSWLEDETNDLRRVYLKMKEYSELPNGPRLSTAAILSAHKKAGYKRSRNGVRHKLRRFDELWASEAVAQLAHDALDLGYDEDEDDIELVPISRKRKAGQSGVTGHWADIRDDDMEEGKESQVGRKRVRRESSSEGADNAVVQPKLNEVSLATKVKELEQDIAAREERKRISDKKYEKEMKELRSTKEAIQKTLAYFKR